MFITKKTGRPILILTAAAMMMTPVIHVQAAGWIQNDTSWSYEENGTLVESGWKLIHGQWYLFKNGIMTTGWQKSGSAWYFLNADGSMKTGWHKDGSSWYYLMPGDGAMKTGWLKDGSVWYYLNHEGIMQTGWQKIDGAHYYFTSEGCMKSNCWIEDKEAGERYYLDSAGKWVKTELLNSIDPLKETVINILMNNGKTWDAGNGVAVPNFIVPYISVRFINDQQLEFYSLRIDMNMNGSYPSMGIFNYRITSPIKKVTSEHGTQTAYSFDLTIYNMTHEDGRTISPTFTIGINTWLDDTLTMNGWNQIRLPNDSPGYSNYWRMR